MLRSFACLLIAVFILWSCSQNQSDSQLYQSPPAEKLDKYCSYLDNELNFNDSSYMTFAYKRYHQLVSENKIDSAAQVLFITGKTISWHTKHDPQFFKVCIDFTTKYKSQISGRYYAGIYTVIGNTYSNLGKSDSSLYYLGKALIKPTDFYTYQRVADVNYRLLFGYLNNGKLEQSLKAGFKALDMFEKQKDTSSIASCYSAIACIYRYQDDYSEAEAYENKGYELMKKTKDTSSLLRLSFNKITLYNDMNSPKLYPFIDSTMKIARQSSKIDDYERASATCWYAFKLVHENKLIEAKKLLDEIKPVVDNVVDEVAKDSYYNALTEYEVKMGIGSKNVDFYRKKIPELKEYEEYQRLQLYNQILHDDALTKNDFKAARDYLEQAQIAKDSLSNQILRSKVKEFDKKYQTQRKEQQIKIQQNEITQKNTSIALLVASLLGLIASASVYYLWQRQKMLKQEKLNSMNFTKQLLENTEEERKRIAGDLHDSISHELLNLKTALGDDIKNLSGKIDSIINEVRGISRNLHPVMFDKIGLVPNIEQLVERIQNQNNFFVSTEINYAGSLSSSNELQIYRIIQEALTNIVKYANAHAAKITIDEQNDKISVEIKDNGKGFNVKEALNSGKAFGLHNMIERSRVIGGEASINSSTEGTIIVINIPKKS